MTESETRSTLPADYERQLRDAHLQPLWLADVSAAILGWYREWPERAPALKCPAAQLVSARIARSPIKETA
jgi:hypothetical protein